MNAWTRTTCRLLIALMAWMPYQIAAAGMIGSQQVVASSQRADMANQLLSLGIDPSTAQNRVAAMSDQEVQSLAGQINTLPAGADAGAALLLIILAAAAFWWFTQR